MAIFLDTLAKWLNCVDRLALLGHGQVDFSNLINLDPVKPDSFGIIGTTIIGILTIGINQRLILLHPCSMAVNSGKSL